MLHKIKSQFIPKDYQFTLIGNLHNLRQKGMTVNEHIEEFFRLSIRARKIEEYVGRLDRYLNGMK